MNRTQLVAQVAASTGLTGAQASAAVDAVIASIVSSVAAGEVVSVPGLGTFDRRKRAARTGRNPRTGEPLTIPASLTPGFKAAAPFKTKVSEG